MTADLATLHAHYLRTMRSGRGDVFSAPWWLYQVELIDEQARMRAKELSGEEKTEEQRDIFRKHIKAA